MRQALVAFGLLLLVVTAPIPLGSNREWSWSLCAVVVALLGLLQFSGLLWSGRTRPRTPPVSLVFLFLLSCTWVLIQVADITPASWHHPLWSMTLETLGPPVQATVSLSTTDSGTALMRLLSYGLVFALAFQLGQDRKMALQIISWLFAAGLVYSIYGLWVYWSGYQPEWLFGDRRLPHDVRGTFINRNHFATWQGLTLLTAIAYFYQRMAKPEVMPYTVPQSRDARVETFILKSWKLLTAILVMVTALVLTHSRAGFASGLAGVMVLLYLLDHRAPSRRGLSRTTIVAALFVASLAFYLTSEVLLDRINRTEITSEERLEVFGDVYRGIGDNTLLGFGYGTFADSFRLYDDIEAPVHYDRAHNSWLENLFELGVPAALALFLCLMGLALVCFRGVYRRHRDWVYPATGAAASVLVGLHAMVDFSLQIPAVALLYACIMGVACAQSNSSAGAQRGHGGSGMDG